jgi:hypothetical protein
VKDFLENEGGRRLYSLLIHLFLHGRGADETRDDEQVEEQGRKCEENDSSLPSLLYKPHNTTSVYTPTARSISFEELTLQQIRSIRRHLNAHHSRRLRVESDPRFIEHAEPLGVLGHRLRVCRGEEELDSVVRVGLEGGEGAFDDGDGVLVDIGTEGGSDEVT